MVFLSETITLPSIIKLFIGAGSISINNVQFPLTVMLSPYLGNT
jgi:hypothetical protein